MAGAGIQKGVWSKKTVSLEADSEESCVPCLPHALWRRPPFLSQSHIPGLVPIMGLIESKSSQSTAKTSKVPFDCCHCFEDSRLTSCAHCAFSGFALSWLLSSTQCASVPWQGLSYWVWCCPVNSRLADPHAAGWVSAFASHLPVGCWDYRCALLASTF